MEKRNLNLKDSSVAFVVGFLACQLAVVIFSFIGLIVCKQLNIAEDSFYNFISDKNNFGYLCSTLIFDSVLVFYSLQKSKHTNNTIIAKPEPKKCIKYIIISILAFFIISPATLCVETWLIKLGLTPSPLQLTLKGYLLGLLTFVLLPAIAEELFMRGLLFKGLKKYGFAFSVCLSSLMFAVFHTSLFQLIFPICFGLLFSVIMYKENNIIYTILMHSTNNFLALTLNYFNINLFINSIWFYILSFALLGLFLYFMISYIIKQNNISPKEKPTKAEIYYLIVSISIMLIIYIAYSIVS